MESIRFNYYTIIYGILSSSSSSSSSSSRSKTLFCLELKSSAKGTSISELQNIKIERDNYNVYRFKQDKYK